MLWQVPPPPIPQWGHISQFLHHRLRMCALWNRYGCVQYGTVTDVCTMGPLRMCTLWDRYGRVHYGTVTDVCTMGPFRMCALWDRYGCVRYAH
jgi:hypothetical protein